MALQRSTSLARGPRAWHVDWWASIRITFGIIWLIDGVLEWQPADFHNFLQLITAMSQGQPAPLGAVISAGQAVVAINPTLANGLLAAVETAVGLSLITNTLSRWALRISVLLAALIWVFGQGFGMVFMAGATDVQSGPLYVLVSLMLLRALPARSYRRSYLTLRSTTPNAADSRQSPHSPQPGPPSPGGPGFSALDRLYPGSYR